MYKYNKELYQVFPKHPPRVNSESSWLNVNTGESKSSTRKGIRKDEKVYR